MNHNELLAKYSEPIKVGKDGFIRLVDVMGDDSSIVQAARTSYGKGTTTVQDDEGLIRYLMRHRHTTPFEMCEIKLHVRVPMDVWRQWIRHRMASVNEYSTRYSEVIDSWNTTPPEAWRLQSEDNKQGSANTCVPLETGKPLTMLEETGLAMARTAYITALQEGVAREKARQVMPLSTYTEAYWKIDLHNLLHFLQLRMDPHAQLEIREFANAIADIVEAWVPAAWSAFLDYRLGAITFSLQEIELLRSILGEELKYWDDNPDARKALFDQANLGSTRERGDFVRKLRQR